MVGYYLDIIIGIVYIIVGFYIVRRFMLKEKPEYVNSVFLGMIAVLYILEVTYIVVMGYNYWNACSIANMSPLLFTLCLVTLFLPKKYQIKMFGFFSMFFVPMILAAFVPNIIDTIRGNNYFQFSTIVDSIAHLSFGLFAYYLIKSGQVRIDRHNLGFYIVNCLVVVIGVIMINLIFRTKFFGLSFFGKHNIYSIVISDSALVSCVVYVAGLLLVVLGGYLIYKFITKKGNNKEIVATKIDKK